MRTQRGEDKVSRFRGCDWLKRRSNGPCRWIPELDNPKYVFTILCWCWHNYSVGDFLPVRLSIAYLPLLWIVLVAFPIPVHFDPTLTSNQAMALTATFVLSDIPQEPQLAPKKLETTSTASDCHPEPFKSSPILPWVGGPYQALRCGWDWEAFRASHVVSHRPLSWSEKGSERTSYWVRGRDLNNFFQWGDVSLEKKAELDEGAGLRVGFLQTVSG